MATILRTTGSTERLTFSPKEDVREQVRRVLVYFEPLPSMPLLWVNVDAFELALPVNVEVSKVAGAVVVGDAVPFEPVESSRLSVSA